MKYIGRKSLSSFLFIIIKISFVVTLIGLCAGILVFFFPSLNDQVPLKASFDYPGLSMSFENAEDIFSYPVYTSIWISGIVLLVILYLLRKIFRNFRNGEVFTDSNVKSMRLTGLSVIILAVVNSITDLMRGRLVVEKLEDLSESMDLQAVIRIDPATLFVGFLILIFAEIFKMARQYKEENELTI